MEGILSHFSGREEQMELGRSVEVLLRLVRCEWVSVPPGDKESVAKSFFTESCGLKLRNKLDCSEK